MISPWRRTESTQTNEIDSLTPHRGITVNIVSNAKLNFVDVKIKAKDEIMIQ